MQEIKCPNCGAPAKNHKNCEFCGSLLVRFANKGIDLSNTTYLNNDGVLPGLIRELDKNIELQKKEEGWVCTDISCEDERYAGGINILGSVITSNKLITGSGDFVFSHAETPSSGVAFVFQLYNSDLESEHRVYKEHRIQKGKFEQLNSFPLFEPYVTPNCIDINGDEFIEYLYAIDFGSDAEGAARLISEIANKVYGCPLNKPLIYKTYTQKESEIENAAIQKEETKNNIKKWIWIVLAALGFLLWLIL